MNGDIGKNISLIPLKSDDNYYDIYYHKTPSNQKLNILLKKSYNLDKINLFNEQNKIGENSAKFRKKQLPKLDLKLHRENKLPSLLKRIPRSGYKNEKLIKREKKDMKEKYFTINNIILDENSIIKKNAINRNIHMKRYIKLSKKNIINKNLINKKFERDMMEFKIYSHNMNEMIAEQMVIEFFKRINKLQSLKFNDLLLNYILSSDGKDYISEKKLFSINNNINNIEYEDKIQNENIENEHNLIIHNVFFEWIITKVIQTYTNNNLKLTTENISDKNIKNIFINEVKNLSKLFFHKKFEKIRNINNLNNKNEDSDNSKEEGNSIFGLEIKKLKIKNELIDNILEKFIKNNSNSFEEITKFNNYPKSVSISKKKYRDMKINLKKNINKEKDMKTINNASSDLSIKNDIENNTELNKYQKNSQMMPKNLRNSMINNKNDIIQKISVETNTDSTLVEKYKNLIGLKDIIEEVENPPLKLYEQYYKHEVNDQLNEDKVTFINKKRITRKFDKNIENNKSEDNPEILKYSNNNRSNKKIFTENNNHNHINGLNSIKNNIEFNEFENLESNDETITEHMRKEKLKIDMNSNKVKKLNINNNIGKDEISEIKVEKEKNKRIEKKNKNKINKNKKANKAKKKKKLKRIKQSNKKLNENNNINEEKEEDFEENTDNDEEEEIEDENEEDETQNEENEEEKSDLEEGEEEEEEEKEEKKEKEEEEEEEIVGSNSLKIKKKKLLKNSEKKKKKKRKIIIIDEKDNEQKAKYNDNNKSINNINTTKAAKENIKKKSQIKNKKKGKKIKIKNTNIDGTKEIEHKEYKNEGNNSNEQIDEIENNNNETIKTLNESNKNEITNKEENNEIKNSNKEEIIINEKNLEKNESEEKAENEGRKEKEEEEQNKNEIKPNKVKKKKKLRKKKKGKIVDIINQNDSKISEKGGEAQNEINNQKLTEEDKNIEENEEYEEEEYNEEEEEESEEEKENNIKKDEKNKRYESDSSDYENQEEEEKEDEEEGYKQNINKKEPKKDKKKSTRKKTTKKTLIYDNSSPEKPERSFKKSDTRKEVLDILESNIIPNNEDKIEKIEEIPYELSENSDTDIEVEKKRKRIKHKKAKKKVALPKLTDTSRGAFEKFKEEQKLEMEKKEEEEKKEREKLKKYFMELKKLKHLNDEGFDHYIKGKFETLKNIKDNNDIKLRKESFIYQIFNDIELLKKRKQRFNFVSPIKFMNK